ncbi:MAG: hypothetical protein WA864_29420 [Acetobacteraceae bacterium]
MSVSVVSHYRGGTPEIVTPLAERMKAAFSKHGVGFRVSRLYTGQNVGDWMVIVQYADWADYAKAQVGIREDPEHHEVVTEISKIVTRISREFVIDLDL